MTGRIPCINPSCRRTAPAEKFPGQEIVCGKCWKLLPKAMTERYRQLRRARRRLERLARNRVRKGGTVPETFGATLDRALQRNWGEIHNYFVAPEKPVGLDTFLEEMGMDL